MIPTNYFDDLPQLTEDQINSYPDSFEWWYFDIVDKDNNSLVIILKRKDTFTHKINPSVYVEYKINGENNTLVKIYPKAEFLIKEYGDEDAIKINFGNNSIKIFKDTDNNIKYYDVSIDFKKLKIELKFFPLHQGFKPNKNGMYFTHKKKSDLIKCVNFASPRTQGEGKIDFFGEIIEFSGEGYHDHPWGTSNLLQTNATWHWGRLFNEHATIFYADVLPHKNFTGKLKFFYFSLIDEPIPRVEEVYEIKTNTWKKESGANLKFPHILKITCPTLDVEVTTKFFETLLNIKIYNRSLVNFELNHKKNNLKTNGTGWTEYWNVPTWMKGLLIKMNRSEQEKHVKNTLKLIK